MTTPIDPIREALPVAYLVTNLPSGEPSLCFEDERGDYGDEDHTPVFEELCLLSGAEAALKAKDAEIEALKERLERSQGAHIIASNERDHFQDDAEQLHWLSGRDLNDLAVGYINGKVLLNIGCGDVFEGADLRAAIDVAMKSGEPS